MSASWLHWYTLQCSLQQCRALGTVGPRQVQTMITMLERATDPNLMVLTSDGINRTILLR